MIDGKMAAVCFLGQGPSVVGQALANDLFHTEEILSAAGIKGPRSRPVIKSLEIQIDSFGKPLALRIKFDTGLDVHLFDIQDRLDWAVPLGEDIPF